VTELHEALHINNTLRQLHLSYNKIKETGIFLIFY
jgi:hypothetical protein